VTDHTTDATKDRGGSRDYPGHGLVVHWNASLCTHSTRCFSALPQVFRPRERPWVDPSAAGADQIAAAIDRCPSGALSYTRTLQEERVSEQPTPAEQPVTVITVTANGPNLVAGNLEIRNEAGELVKTAKRLALCRCGGSSTKPFCDGTHKLIGFTDPGPSAG
jgi:uncharacterized Fe-S cluster protein YjdI